MSADHSIEERLAAIEERNRRVEAEKAWETSWFRALTITIGTYVAATLLLWIINVDQPWIGSLVPAMGYFLSTLSLPALKQWWIHQRRG